MYGGGSAEISASIAVSQAADHVSGIEQVGLPHIVLCQRHRAPPVHLHLCPPPAQFTPCTRSLPLVLLLCLLLPSVSTRSGPSPTPWMTCPWRWPRTRACRPSPSCPRSRPARSRRRTPSSASTACRAACPVRGQPDKQADGGEGGAGDGGTC